MDEIHKNQESVAQLISQENSKYLTIEQKYDFEQMIHKACDYNNRLLMIKKSMLNTSDRASKLRKRAIKILDLKSKSELEKQRSKERRELLEKHLEPVVNTTRK